MDEPLFNELLESVKQADQIMTDHAELRRLAGLASGGNWYGEDSQVLVGKHAIAYCNHKVDAQFIGEANPKTILALLDEIDGLKAENEALRGALHAVQAEVDGNLRPLTRDLVNMVSGLNNGSHPNDIYEHCNEIERIIGAALEGAMTDINKLKELAVRALPFAPGEWFVENGIDQVRDCANDFVCETGEDDPIKASFIAAANPQTILKLIAEVERLRIGLKGDFDLDAWLEWTREKDQIKAEIEALRRFAAEAYQVLGALEAPENVLDNASDAANGVPLRHETLLPFFAEDYESMRKDAERYRFYRQGFVSPSELDTNIDAALEGAKQ
ncbi:hypothetical protein ACM799_28860 [Pseudomonas aeruginosa]